MHINLIGVVLDIFIFLVGVAFGFEWRRVLLLQMLKEKYPHLIKK